MNQWGARKRVQHVSTMVIELLFYRNAISGFLTGTKISPGWWDLQQLRIKMHFSVFHLEWVHC